MNEYNLKKFEIEKKGETPEQLIKMIRASGSGISSDCMSTIRSEGFLFGGKEGKVRINIIEAGYFLFPPKFTEKNLFSDVGKGFLKDMNCGFLDPSDPAYLRNTYIDQPVDNAVWCLQEKMLVPPHGHHFIFTLECNEKGMRLFKVLQPTDQEIDSKTLIAVRPLT